MEHFLYKADSTFEVEELKLVWLIFKEPWEWSFLLLSVYNYWPNSSLNSFSCTYSKTVAAETKTKLHKHVLFDQSMELDQHMPIKLLIILIIHTHYNAQDKNIYSISIIKYTNKSCRNEKEETIYLLWSWLNINIILLQIFYFRYNFLWNIYILVQTTA